MVQLSDKLLIEFTQGKPQAFNAVFDSFRMRIFYFIKNIIDDGLSAEEITSDTFVKLYRLHAKFKSFNNIQSFLFTTARNAALDYLRQRQRRTQMTTFISFEYEPEDTVLPMFAEQDIETEVLQLVYREIEELPSKSRQVFKLFYLEDKTVGEIANIMKTNTQTVANQKTTAIKQLRMKILVLHSLIPLKRL